MKIIVGLGNPGLRYRNTRHNAGFIVIDRLAKRNRLKVKKSGFGGIYGTGRILGEEVTLFKPLTYMNLSGEAVKALFSSKGENKEELLVVTDDFALPLGKIRLKGKGSSGGHNGLSSVIERLGEDFPRLRVGIGTENKIEEATSFVLGSFTRKEKPLLKEAAQEAAECAELWLTEGAEKAMRRYNS